MALNKQEMNNLTNSYEPSNSVEIISDVSNETISRVALFVVDPERFSTTLTVELADKKMKKEFGAYCKELLPRLKKNTNVREELEEKINNITIKEQKFVETLDGIKNELKPLLTQPDLLTNLNDLEQITKKINDMAKEKERWDNCNKDFNKSFTMRIDTVNDNLKTFFQNIRRLRSLQHNKTYPVDTLDIWDACRRGPLTAAKYWLKPDTVFLDQELDPFDHKYHLLHWAVLHRHVNIAKHLLDKKANANVRTAIFGQTALHIAAHNDHIEMVKMLAETDGCDLHLLDDDDENVLHMAAHVGSLTVFKYLSEDCNVNMNQKNKKGLVPADVAKNQSIITYLDNSNQPKDAGIVQT